MGLSRISVSAIACPGTLRCAPCLSGASGRVDSEATAMLRPVLGEVINGTANGSSTPTSSSSACGSPGSSCALNGTIKAPLSIFAIRSRLLKGAASPPAASANNCRRLNRPGFCLLLSRHSVPVHLRTAMPSFTGDDGLSDAERIAYAVCNPVARLTRGRGCSLGETLLAVSDSQCVCLSSGLMQTCSMPAQQSLHERGIQAKKMRASF